jgi:hypothetical protein
MIDPTSFLLGMLAHDFLARSVKKSQLTAVMIALLFGIVLVDVLLRIGAFDQLLLWWQAIRGI